jgi:hypothetical protein
LYITLTVTFLSWRVILSFNIKSPASAEIMFPCFDFLSFQYLNLLSHWGFHPSQCSLWRITIKYNLVSDTNYSFDWLNWFHDRKSFEHCEENIFHAWGFYDFLQSIQANSETVT